MTADAKKEDVLRGMGPDELAKLRGSLRERRREAEAKLGARLYPLTKDDVRYTAGNQSLYDTLADLYQEDEAIGKRLEEIERERAAGLECPNCHTILQPDDQFCMGCGMPRAAVEKALQEVRRRRFCPQCGSEVGPGERFCSNCGCRLP